MKKWDDDNRLRIHNKKINNAKSLLPPMITKQRAHNQSSTHHKSMIKELMTRQSEFTSTSSQKSTEETFDYINSPVYKLLKPNNLQQYAHKLIQRGYGTNIRKLAQLSPKEFNQLLEDIKVLPGHTIRMQNLIDILREIIEDHALSVSPGSPQHIEEKPASKITESKKPSKKLTSPIKFVSPYIASIPQKKPQKLAPVNTHSSSQKGRNLRIQKLGLDFFHNQDDEFAETIQQVLQKYQVEEQHGSTTKTVKKQSPRIEPPDSSTKSIHSVASPLKTTKVQTYRKSSQQQMMPIVKLKDREEKSASFKVSSHNKAIVKNPRRSQDVPNQRLNVLSKVKKQITAQDDINLISEFRGNSLVTQVRETKLRQNLRRLIGETNDKELTPIQDLDRPNIQMDPIKNMYISFDSIKMTSTLVNLDIEEMCNCLGWAIQKHIDFGESIASGQTQYITNNTPDQLVPTQSPMNQSYASFSLKQEQNTQQHVPSMNESDDPPQIQREITQEDEDDEDFNDDEEPSHPQYVYDEDGNEIDLNEYQSVKKLMVNIKCQQPKHSLGAISEKTLEASQPPDPKIRRLGIQCDNSFQVDPEVDRSQVESILRDSMLNKYDEPVPESSHEYDSDQKLTPVLGETTPVLLTKQTYANNVLNISMESKFDYVDNDLETEEETQKTFQRIYNENDPFVQVVIPTVEVICNYCKNIIITAKMEKEVAIVCLVYVERLLIHSGLYLTAQNWRKIVFTALIIGSKIWDDESFENNNFAKAFPQHTTTQINEFERVFLQLIKYNLYVKSSDYAKYYFLLRAFAEKKKKSFPLRSLDVKTVLYLQRNSNKAEKVLKEHHSHPLNKSF